MNYPYIRDLLEFGVTLENTGLSRETGVKCTSEMHDLDKFGTVYHKYDGEVSKLSGSRLILKDVVE